MLYKIDLSIPLNAIQTSLESAIKTMLPMRTEFVILKRSVDARRKGNIKMQISIRVDLTEKELSALKTTQKQMTYTPFTQKERPSTAYTERTNNTERHPVIIGSGPAGLFCALRLLQHGITSLILEQGAAVEERAIKISDLWTNGVLDERTNVQFGEGGAGTFSDGKLNTSKNNLNITYVLEQFHRYGAPEEILYDAKPHIGTNKLQQVVKNLREHLIQQGCRVRFNSEVTDLVVQKGRIKEVVVNGNENLPLDTLILAIGNSSRKLFRILHAKGIALQQKPFAVGFRIEHPQGLIDEIQYGLRDRPPILPPADYKLTFNKDGKGVYSFCMCPGGQVIAAASEQNRGVVNGMSTFERNSGYANSALVVSVTAEDTKDMPGDPALHGLVFQEQLEEKTFALGGGNFRAPVQKVLSFLKRTSDSQQTTCTYRPGTSPQDLNTLLPEHLNVLMHDALAYFNGKMDGFTSRDAVLIGTETRTSSPITVLRGEDGKSISHNNLYPCGEGAGYAGGIMSAALDGIMVAEKIAVR